MSEVTRERTVPPPAGRNAVGGVAHAPHRPLHRGGRLRRVTFRVQERVTVVGYRFTSWLLGKVPLAISWPLFRVAFLTAYVAWPAKRRIVQANAARVLGRAPDDPQVRALVRRIFQTYARYVVELMRLPSRPEEEIRQLVIPDGERGLDSFIALYERCRSEDRGMIAVSCHVGSIETFVAAFADRGWPTVGLADDTAYPELYALLQEQRRRWGVEVLGWRNMRGIIRALRDGAILGLLVDWGYRADDVPVRLFGSWTTLPAGPAVLAAKTRAMILPMVALRRPDGRFEALHYDPIEIRDDSPAEIARATQAIADAVQAMIAPAPEQWYSFKAMWPGTPEEVAALETRGQVHAAAKRGLPGTGAATGDPSG